MIRPVILHLSVLFILAQWVDAAQQLIDPTSKDNAKKCQCFLTSGPDPGYFQYHRFWDFRNVAGEKGNNYTVAPALINATENQGSEDITSNYLQTSKWQADWSIQNNIEEPNAIVPSVNSPRNVFISRNSTAGAESSTYLTLRANRLPSFMSISEIDSNQKNLMHSSIRGRFRVIPNGLDESSAPSVGSTSVDDYDSGSNSSHPVDDGAVFGFFTYHSSSAESDIEILTYDRTTEIHYSNQPDYNYRTNQEVSGASTQVSMPNGARYTEWQDHRIDWFDGISRWYVNDQLVLEKTINVPREPSGFIMNLWGDGQQWSGNMSVGGQVMVGIQWIEMAFNVSGKVWGKREELWKRKNQNCEIGCSIDDIQQVGFPEVSYDVSAAGSFIRQGRQRAGGVCGVALFIALFIMFI